MIRRSEGYGDRTNPDYVKNPGAASAEESILGILLLHPELYSELCRAGDGLTADDFFTAFGKKVFLELEPRLSDPAFEAGMLGYALFVLLFPEESVSQFALPDIGQTLFVFTLYKVLLSGKRDVKVILKDMATTPILWAVLAGVLIGATGLYGLLEQWGVSGVLNACTDFLSAPTGMIILLTVGYDLVIKEIPWKKTAGFIAMRLVIAAICFAVSVLLNRTLLGGMLFEGAMLLMVILPPPYVIPVFADEPAERVSVSSALSAMTLVTIVLFALLSIFVGMQ